MDREWLAGELAAGRSIESIAREAGRHPSTVAYWVNKHGLASLHAPKHRAKGAIERSRLEALIRDGLSIRAIGERLGVSYSTVRHWLRKYDLATPRARRITETAAAREAGLQTVTATCASHGVTAFGRKSDGGYRCLKCRSEAVVARRRRVKERLVAEAGGRCEICGYDRSAAALQFHHTDPAAKAFSIAHRGVTRSLEAALAEARKCVLLCATCHAEVETGVATLPAVGADQVPG
jgi:transposase-like protein